jgi:hypothetical protein
MPTIKKGKSATLTLNPQGQDLAAVNKMMAAILKRAGCAQCGRLAVLKVDFAGDPGPDFAGIGGISFRTEGF